MKDKDIEFTPERPELGVRHIVRVDSNDSRERSRHSNKLTML